MSNMSEERRAKLFSVLKTSAVTWNEDYVAVAPKDRTDLLFLQDAFSSFGYARDFDISDSTISISNAQGAWATSRTLYFYTDRKSFWIDYNSASEGRYYFVTECKSTNLVSETTDLSVALNCFSSWKMLFLKLSDHVGTASSSDTFVFFVGGEKGARKYSVTPRLTLANVLSLATPFAHNTAVRLLSFLDVKDAQETERRETMRVALVDFFDDLDVGSKELFSESLKKHETLLSKYVESFDTLIHRYSINKALEEVAEKNVDYINKLNETISSAQSKAFAIPGAIIAIGALVRTFGFAEALLVLIGLWMVKVITKGTNEIQLTTLKNLEFQVREAFGRYSKASDEAAVKRKAESAMSSILDLIVKAKIRIKDINCLSNIMLISAVVYMIYRVVSPYIVLFFSDVCLIRCGHVTRVFAIL